MTAAALLARVAEAGYRVTVDSGHPRLVPLRPGRAFPPALLALLKEHRAAVVAHLTPPERCRLCGREVTAEDREHLANNPLLCDRGGSRAVRDGNGVHHPAEERCPWKM